MRYIIHNKNLIGDLEQQNSFEKKISTKINLLKRVLSNYRKNLLLEVYVSKVNSHSYKVSLSLKLKSKLLFLEEKGSNILTLANNLLEKLRNVTKQQIVKEKKEHLYKRKQRKTESFSEYAHHLDSYYAEKENEQFKHLIKKLLPSLHSYILRYLQTHGHDIKLRFSVQEIVDEVYIHLFERFNERPITSDDLSSWIYNITREYLEKHLMENSIEKEQLDISKLAEAELKTMEEKITTDAEGEIILLEELDDISYNYDHYGPEVLSENAFVDYPEMDPISEDIQNALDCCNETERMIFEMFWIDELSEKEIGKSLGIGKKQIIEIIKNVTQRIESQIKQNLS